MSNEKAINELDQKLQLDTDQGPVTMAYVDWIMLTEKLTMAGNTENSQIIVDQLSRLFPDDVIPQVLRLNNLVEERLHSKAIELAENLTPRIHDNPVVLSLCVRAFRQAGCNGHALELAKSATRDFPGDPIAQHELGLSHLSCGNNNEALTAFNEAIRLQPEFIAPYWSRARISAGKLRPTQIEHMIKLQSRTDLPAEDKTTLEFALAWAYEGVDCERHFEHLCKANSEAALRRPWDEKTQQEKLTQTLNFFDLDLIRHAKDHAIFDLAPIFIIGLPRTGTSLVEQILATHTEVTGCGETGGMEKAIALSVREFNLDPDIYKWADKTGFGELFRPLDTEYRHSLHLNIETPHFTDKSLSTDWLAGLLLMMYPRSRVIHCIRNPLDVCLSMYQLLFANGQNYSYRLSSIAKTIQIHRTLMDHWKTLFPDQIHCVPYEDIVNDQRKLTGELLKFCGLPWQEGCMDFHQQPRAARTASDSQIKQPIYRSAIGRWKPYAKHLEEAADILGISIT